MSRADFCEPLGKSMAVLNALPTTVPEVSGRTTRRPTTDSPLFVRLTETGVQRAGRKKESNPMSTVISMTSRKLPWPAAGAEDNPISVMKMMTSSPANRRDMGVPVANGANVGYCSTALALVMWAIAPESEWHPGSTSINPSFIAHCCAASSLWTATLLFGGFPTHRSRAAAGHHGHATTLRGASRRTESDAPGAALVLSLERATGGEACADMVCAVRHLGTGEPCAIVFAKLSWRKSVRSETWYIGQRTIAMIQ